MDTTLFYRYWGKAQVTTEAANYHLLPYHCLDVAAITDAWWRQSQNIRRCFIQVTGLSEEQAKAWVLFFIALHDYGKFDLRFQRKAPKAWNQVNSELSQIEVKINGLEIKKYNHGPAGLYWFYQDNKERFAHDDFFDFDDNDDWLAWFSWLAPVMGHHGMIPEDGEKDSDEYRLSHVPETVRKTFQQARQHWLEYLEKQFLTPAGLGLDDTPPRLEKNNNQQSFATMLAGFCSVCDWLGSSDFFKYDSDPSDNLSAWYEQRINIAAEALEAAGVIGKIKPYQDIKVLLKGHAPRQIQVLCDDLPHRQSLTIIEASTGSGKTEAALAYAWQLLVLGLADSIVFALPTQATANAMLERLEKAAPLLFDNKTNVVLAHGRANYQPQFINLKQACEARPAQGKEEAWIQCGQWLSQSRKRVFLGQIGVCTIDQVLVSVLPVRHKFVRGFGVGRSVLIIDEVHAYDSYMYGLLDAVLEQQYLAGGSAILLSATLPSYQKQQLAKTWGCHLAEDNQNQAYPLITSCYDKQTHFFDLTDYPEQQPPITTVNLELLTTPHCLPVDDFYQRLIHAVAEGAPVCLICNLVADAQAIYQAILESITETQQLKKDQLLLFHSRFTFADRQRKEQTVLNLFGPNPEAQNVRNKGHLLIATQVVEQSLDLDFDWLITQLCPVDLLFQRMGRLHRHPHDRPKNYREPCCTVLLPDNEDYELHELIYGHSRVLWRTEQLLKKHHVVTFPKAYRDWIEAVYQPDEWENEPEAVIKSFTEFEEQAYASQMTAKQLVRSSMKILSDDDNHVTVLTRDGEMSLNLVPYYRNTKGEKCLLDGTIFDQLDESQRLEALNLNTVAVPASWGHHGQLGETDSDDILWLAMEQTSDQQFVSQIGEYVFTYQPNTGLSRTKQCEEK